MNPRARTRGAERSRVSRASARVGVVRRRRRRRHPFLSVRRRPRLSCCRSGLGRFIYSSALFFCSWPWPWPWPHSAKDKSLSRASRHPIGSCGPRPPALAVCRWLSVGLLLLIRPPSIGSGSSGEGSYVPSRKPPLQQPPAGRRSRSGSLKSGLGCGMKP